MVKKCEKENRLFWTAFSPTHVQVRVDGHVEVPLRQLLVRLGSHLTLALDRGVEKGGDGGHLQRPGHVDPGLVSVKLPLGVVVRLVRQVVVTKEEAEVREFPRLHLRGVRSVPNNKNMKKKKKR